MKYLLLIILLFSCACEDNRKMKLYENAYAEALYILDCSWGVKESITTDSLLSSSGEYISISDFPDSTLVLYIETSMCDPCLERGIKAFCDFVNSVDVENYIVIITEVMRYSYKDFEWAKVLSIPEDMIYTARFSMMWDVGTPVTFVYDKGILDKVFVLSQSIQDFTELYYNKLARYYNNN